MTNKNTYNLPVKCRNCLFRTIIEIPKGLPVYEYPNGTIYTGEILNERETLQCPNCEIRSLLRNNNTYQS